MTEGRVENQLDKSRKVDEERRERATVVWKAFGIRLGFEMPANPTKKP